MIVRHLVRLLVFCVAFSTLACDKQEPGQAPATDEAETPAAAAPSIDEPAASNDEPEASEEADASTVVEKSLLWRVETKHGPVFLFGTVHGGIDGTWDEFPQDARNALERSELVVLEADLENAAASAMKVRDKMMYPEGTSLRDEIGAEAFSKLSTELGTPSAVLDRMRPWTVYSELTRKWLPPGASVDELVQQQGKAHGHEFDFIETVPQQVDILAGAITPAVLRDTLMRLEEMKKQQDQLIAAYLAGDVDKLEDVAFDEKEMERFPELYEALFDKRNEAWMSDIESYIERGNVFVAVGVGHLVGEGGLVARLEERGYEVERTAAGSSGSDE